MVSYADLVTLLLACFATAFAASKTEPQPLLASRPTVAMLIPLPEPFADVPAEPEEPALNPRTAALRDVVARVLAGAIGEGQLELLEDPRGLVISLPESATFSSGSADLTTDARSLLRRLAGELRPTGATIRVEGHTDDRPIKSGRFMSNWELSTARASAVVIYLVTSASFEPERLSAAGYGEFHPRVANQNAEQRARNRRVDMVVLDGGSGEPLAGEADQ
jgi:chemotaxis protein MotB